MSFISIDILEHTMDWFFMLDRLRRNSLYFH
jgi:hypothetical protein